MKELSTIEGIKPEQQEIYKKALTVIERASNRKEMQKQHIRNFFRKLFNKQNNLLLNGTVTSLTKEDILNMLDSIKEKPQTKNFMDNYNKEKTDVDKMIDSIESNQVKTVENENSKQENER